jgi:hypothetical protein
MADQFIRIGTGGQDEEAGLSWDAVDGAIGYTIYWDTVPISFNPLDYANSYDAGNVTEVSFSAIPDLGSGTRYFAIASYDEGGHGPRSNEIEETV